MQTMRSDIAALMERLTFPAEATETLLLSFDRIAENAVAAAWWRRLVARYEETVSCHYKQMLEDAKSLGATLGIHEYAMGMLLFLCLGKKLRERYAARGIDESIYYNSMMDLRYKLEECRLIHGEVGSFVAFWFPGFFDLTRFALGRLQFEVVKLKASYTVGDVVLPEQAKAINIHIPRTGGKLDHGDVLAAYAMAAEVFGAEFADQPIVFTCESWMLDPWHEEVLSPDSNMVAFLKDFKIVEVKPYVGYKNAWRIFDRAIGEDIDALPAGTSLQRAYVDKMKRGEPLHYGRGVFIWKDGAICC